jgi:hypothetical protein
MSPEISLIEISVLHTLFPISKIFLPSTAFPYSSCEFFSGGVLHLILLACICILNLREYSSHSPRNMLALFLLKHIDLLASFIFSTLSRDVITDDARMTRAGISDAQGS